MDRRCAGALLALAACIAGTAAAPTASNQTALDLYDGAQQGCYYNFQHYGEGDRIMTNEPCLNCTCHNRMLMCYLRVCPFTKPIGQDCSVEKRADQCCPIVTCPDVPVDLLTSTSTTSPAEYGETGLGKLDRYGCSINGKYFPEGAKVPPTPSKPCEHCYCIRNMTTCVMQECTLHVDGCTPIYHKDVCCPVRYSCDHPEDEIPLLDDMTTTVRPTPGFLLTTTTLSPVTQMTQDCVHDDKVFADGALIKTEKACEHCYCMKGDIVCVVQECGTPMENEGKNCTSMPPREGQCCPDTYICEGDELTTETKPDTTTLSSDEDDTTTLSPPRRVIVEGSGYRKEPGEPFTEEPTFEPDTEGSGEDESFKPIDDGKEDTLENETTRPIITTDTDEDIDQFSPSTSKVPVVDSEMTDDVTTEPDKGENTVPSGGMDEIVTEMSTNDKTTPEESKLATESGVTTESYYEAKTTALHDDESSIADKITTETEAAPTKVAPIAETTMADYQSPSISEDKATAEPTEVTEGTPDKQDDKMPHEYTTPEIKDDELTTKAATDYESVTSPVDHEPTATTTKPLSELENELLSKVPTTESHLEASTISDIVKTETESATTITPEVTTAEKEHTIETTSVNPVDNEIDEESYPTSSPGRIPGEGDCLLDGITYSNESIVPSNNNCHTSCRCISSIVKCDPIICSAPPDYMDNCQPMYDPPESCCPTYVCDHTKETVPPQSHSQMAGTESPILTPSIECDGDQCEVSKDKEDSGEPTDSVKKSDDCGTEGCQGSDKIPSPESHPSTEECAGDKCTSPQANCADGKCETPITPDQICDSENGCKAIESEACQGDNCKTLPDISPAKDSSVSCDNADDCKDGQTLPAQAHCTDGKCEIPTKPSCEGEDCKTQPEIIPADSTGSCGNAVDCKEVQVPAGDADCEGESCTSKTDTKDKAHCEDGSDCSQPDQSAGTVEECKEESCRRKDVSDISKPITGECTGSDCLPQDNLPQATDAPEITTETVSKITVLPGSDETIPQEPVTDLPKEPDVEKEIEPKLTTEASIFVKDEENQLSTQHEETDEQKQETITDLPEIKTQAPEVQKQTEISSQQETTVTQLEITPEPTEESSTNPSKLSDSETGDKLADREGITESVSKPTEQTLLDDHRSETPQENIVNDQQEHDLTTIIPTMHDVTTEIKEDATVYTEKNYPDVDTNTKVPEYVYEKGETQTESSTTVSSLDDVKEADKDSEQSITESAEKDSSVSGETSTEKLNEEPTEIKPHDIITTTKSYDDETIGDMDSLKTTVPGLDSSEEPLDTHTASPEQLSTTLEDQKEDKKETDLPGSAITSDEPITSKPDDIATVTEGMVAPSEEPETKLPILPEVSPSDEDKTTTSESTAISEEELFTKAPSHITTDEEAVTSSEMSDSKAPTEAPMSIVKDKEEDETKPTQESEISVSIGGQETTQTSVSFETPSTESYSGEPDQKKPEMGETVKDDDKEFIPDTEKPAGAVTDKDILDHDSSTEQPSKETEIPEIPAAEPSTENTPVTVSIIEQPEQPEPSDTEVGVHEPAMPGEETSDTVPVTSQPTENVDTKSPETFTESPMQTTSENVEATPTKDQPAQTEDTATEIPELTIHEHPESKSTTEKPEQSDTSEDITTISPDVSATEPQSISSQTNADDMPYEPENITNAPEITATESQKEVTEAPGQEPATSDTLSTEPSENKLQDVTTTVPDLATELPKETTHVPEVHDGPTEGSEINAAEPEKITTEATAQQDITTSDFVVPVTEPAIKVTETLDTQEITTNIPDSADVTESHKDSTEPPSVQKIPDVSEETPYKESTEISDSIDIATNAPKISEQASDNEPSELPSTQDTTTKVPEISDATESGVEKEEPEVPNVQEITTVLPEIMRQKDVTESPDIVDIVTDAPKAPVTESLEKASESSEPQEDVTKVTEIFTTEAQKDSDDTATSVPEMFATESPKETTEPSASSDIATNIPESPATESAMEVTQASVTQDAAINISETPSSETKKDVTEIPVVQDIVTEFVQTEPTESQMTEDVTTNIPEILATELQKEVTKVPEALDHDANIPESPVTDSPIEVTEIPILSTDIPESPVTDSQKEVTEIPVPQDKITNIPESLATEPQKEVTEAPVAEDKVTSIPVIPSSEPEKEVTEAPFDKEAAPSTPEAPSIETKKDTTETPGAEDVVSVIPDTSATEIPVTQDGATSKPEIPVTEFQLEVTESPVTQDITTNVSEISDTESQKEVTESPETQTLATKKQDIPATEIPKEVTEAPVTQEDATGAPEVSEAETQKTTEATVTQDIISNVEDTSETDTQKDVTDVPISQDIATSVPETSPTETQKEATESPVSQDYLTTESLHDVTGTMVGQDEAVTISEVVETESPKDVTESPISQDKATIIPETSATESQKEAVETPAVQDIITDVPGSSTTESQKDVTESPVAQDITTGSLEISTTESQKDVTEAPVVQDVVKDNEIEAPVIQDGIDKTESPKYDTTMSPETDLLHEQSTKVPESLVTELQDMVTDEPTVKLTTSQDDSPDEKHRDDEGITESPIDKFSQPEEHKEPERSDGSTELPDSSESVQPDIKSPESPVTERQDDTVTKSPDQSETQDQTTKTSDEPEQTSELPETTPYLVLLEEHTHKKDVYTESPDERLTTDSGFYQPSTEISADDVTESVLVTEAEVPPKQETIPTEKHEPTGVTEETISEKVTEPSLVSEEITTISPLHVATEEQQTEKPQDLETNEISTATPDEEQKEAEKPSTSAQDDADNLVPVATEKPHETTAPEEEFILATTKATTIKIEEDLTSPSLTDKYGKPEESPKPAVEPETQKPDVTDELPKPGVSEVPTTEEAPQPDSESQFPPSGSSGYGQEPDYGEEDQAFGPGTCRYGGKVYVSAQQIPRDDPCDFCFCFRSDIICLQQSCPPPIHGCHEEPIQGFCCPRYECPVSMATTLNVTTTTTTTTTTLPPHFLPHAYKGAAQRRGCQIKGHTYKVGEVVRASSGPCLHCTCGGDGQMKCDPKVCTPEPMLRQMIAAAVAAKRRR